MQEHKAAPAAEPGDKKTDCYNDYRNSYGYGDNPEKILNDNLFVGMGFTTEFLFECAHNNFKIIEMPINLHSREYGNSYVNLVNVLKSILDCIAIYFFKKYTLKINTSFIKKSINTILRLLYKIKNNHQ